MSAAIRVALLLTVAVFAGSSLRAQETAPDWQADVQRAADAHDWNGALRTIDQQRALYPDDMDIRAWRARVLGWSGKLSEAEHEYRDVLTVLSTDPDNWIGLANVYLQEGKNADALIVANRAVELDPKRSDLRITRAQILRAAGSRTEAREDFQRALELDPSNQEARAGISSLRGDAKHELRFGFDTDMFSFTSQNHDQWVSVVSKWSPHWTTSAAGNLYQRGGTDAGKFAGSVTRTQPKWGALTVGGATGHDNGVIPETEAFFDLDRGFKVSEDRPVRGVEFIYGQHWYWYTTARITTVNETAIVYLPRDWTWSLGLTQARSHFSDTGVDWKPSGLTRLTFPLGHRAARNLTGNVFYAVGAEDFAQVDQIGSFAAQVYGGGFKLQITERQDVTGYAAFQQRTQDRAQTSFGFSYGIRF